MPPVPVRLDRPMPLDVRPGGEIIVTGSCYLSHDGSMIDAATTYWPPEAPGGASRDPVGLIDAAASGFSIKSRDPVERTVTFLAPDGPSAMCQAAGYNSVCIIPALPKLAVTRGITSAELLANIKGANGCLTVEVPEPPILAPAAPLVPYLGIAAGIGAMIAVGLVALRVRKKRRESPTGQLLALARRVQGKLHGADVVLAAPLSRAVDTALSALRAGRVDPASIEGKRVASVLLRVETRLDSHAAETRAEQEREAADELVREVESALEAAEEASAIGAKTATTKK